jgi:hypothetical protein
VNAETRLSMSTWLDSLMYEHWGSRAITFKLGGKIRSFATDGHGLTMVDGDWGTSDEAGRSKSVATLLKLDSGDRASHCLPLAVLRAWLPTDPPRIACGTCEGGKIKEFKCETCRGRGWTDCSECGHSRDCHECGGAKKSEQCSECEGDEWVAAPLSCAEICPGVVINRRVMQRYLGPLLQAENVKITTGGELDAVFLYGPDWTVVVMPILYDREALKADLGPRLIEAEAVSA